MQKEVIVYKYPETIDTRVALLEQSVENIHHTLIRLETKLDKRFDAIDKRFDEMDKKFEGKHTKLEDKMDGQFRWVMGSIFGIYISIMGVTITALVKSLHWL